MKRSAFTGSLHTQSEEQSPMPPARMYGELPNRLLTAIEVAEFVGCHEETVRRAYLRGLLTSHRFGVRGRRFHPRDVLDSTPRRRRAPWGPRGSSAAHRREFRESLPPGAEATNTGTTIWWMGHHIGIPEEEEQMAVRKICKQKGCRASPRCEHPWWFDVMHEGKRWRMPVDDFAIPRGANEPVTSKQTAEKVWEPKFLGEIMAGRDPRKAPSKPVAEGELTVADFLERYYTNYVEAEGLRSADTIAGHIKALKASLGELPVTVLEKPTDIARFKAEYRKGHEVATVNRALGVLRAAINWGRFQDRPLLSTTPFHRFGVSIKAREETKRDRRIHRDEEQTLLSAALTMNTAQHKWVGPAMHDRIIGALETCCRQGEMLRIQNRDVDWAQHQLVIRGVNAKDSENRRIPFDPHGRLAPILRRRAALGSYAYVFGSAEGEFQDSFKTAWESLLLVAHGHETKREKPGAGVDREKLRRIDLHWHDLRHEGACRLLADGVDIRIIQLMLGHSDIKTTQRYLNITDEELRKVLTGVWERRRQLKAVNQ